MGLRSGGGQLQRRQKRNIAPAPAISEMGLASPAASAYGLVSANDPSENTDFPSHIRSALPARRNAVRLALASAAFSEMRGGHPPAGSLPVPSLEPALLGFGVCARISASGSYPLQLGVRGDHLPRAAAAGT